MILRTFILLTLIPYIYADTLTLLNWEDYLSENTISAWEAKSGHEIHQIYFDNDEDRDSILINHTDQVIDLVIVDEIATTGFGKNGFLLPVKDYQTKPILAEIDPEIQSSCGQYGLPYLRGTFGIAYRSDKIADKPKSWAFILQPNDEIKNHIGLVDDYMDMLAPPLFMLGESINSENPKVLKEAFFMLKNTVPSVLTFEYGISYIEADSKRDQLYVTLAYSGDQYALNTKAGKEIWEYTTLEEGTIAWVDCLTVMADSPRKEIVYDFINFIYQPKIAAENSESIYVASPLASARALQSSAFLSDASVYPDEKIMNKAQYYKPLPSKNITLRNRITSSIIKSHEAK